jgi:hypothetical protein
LREQTRIIFAAGVICLLLGVLLDGLAGALFLGLSIGLLLISTYFTARRRRE